MPCKGDGEDARGLREAECSGAPHMIQSLRVRTPCSTERPPRRLLEQTGVGSGRGEGTEGTSYASASMPRGAGRRRVSAL